MLAASLLVAGGLLWTGCDVLGTSEPDDSGSATMSLLLTDAPSAEITSAEVVINTIYLQGEGENDSRDTLLSEQTDPIDLLELRDRTMELVEDDTIAAGTYSQLRLVLGSVELTTSSGTYSTGGTPGPGPGGPNGGNGGSLICPSCSQSGLKINLPAQLVVGENAVGESTLVLDFDVSQSFGHAAGQSGMWVMHPVITASRVEASGSVEGSVNFTSEGILPDSCGSASPTVEEFQPLLLDAETDSVVKSGTVAADSSFTVSYVEAGTYTASYEDTVAVGAEDSVLVFSATPEPGQVEVSTGQSASLDYQIDGASCVAAM